MSESLHSYYRLLNLHDLLQVSACLMYLSMSSDCFVWVWVWVSVSGVCLNIAECQNFKLSVVRSDDRSSVCLSSGQMIEVIEVSVCQNVRILIV